MLVVFLRFQRRQNGFDGGLDVAHQPEVELGSTAKMIRSNIDLRDARVGWIPCCVRKIRAWEQYRIRLFERVMTALGSQQSSHPNRIRIVVFEKLLPSEAIGNGCLQSFPKLKNFFVCAGAARAAEQSDLVRSI